MGNHLTQFEMDDDYEDDVLDSYFEQGSSEYREHIANALERMVSSIIGTVPRHFTTKMPIIRKKPDLRTIRQTPLYREIKQLAGLPPNNKIPTDRWSLEKCLLKRETGIAAKPPGSFSENQCRRIANLYIPNHKEQRLMSLESKVFVGKFNKDGSKLITASQDNIVRVFDASKGTYHRINRITAQDVSWCILDIDFSPCGEYFVYSTWSDYLLVVPLHGRTEDFQWIHLNPENSRCCVFSVKFSACGNFLIGGSNDACVHIYDRSADRRVKKIKTDRDDYTDINAVSFVDETSPKIFVSGCDNGIIKLWDERCLGEKCEPVAVFLGHFDGITYIDPRNDGRYILSNSKDQSIKIWDLRRPSPREKEHAVRSTRSYSWDYRWDNVPREFYNPSKELDGESSVMTYRGHRVTKSLIRARFSPLEQTGQRYIYTGCGTGRVIIYDVLTGYIREAIEGHKDIVRDVAWHPVRNEIISSSWDTHVNLNTFRRIDFTRKSSPGSSNDDDRPLRRSRRIALRVNQNHDNDADNTEFC